MLRLTIFIALMFSASGLICAQSVTPTPTPSVNRVGNVRPLNDKDDIDFSRRTSIENLPAEYRPSSGALKKTKFTDAEKEYYKTAKKDGLKLLKLYSAPKCADKFVVDVADERCATNYDNLPISYYSFFDGVYGQIYGELKILDGLLVAGNGRYVHGLLVELRDSEVERLDKKSPVVKSLIEYSVATKTDDVDKQIEGLEKGIPLGELTISSWKKLRAGQSYLLRIIAYGQAEEPLTPYNYDSVLAFRVDKIGDDNIAVILWKKLSEKTAPRIQPSKK